MRLRPRYRLLAAIVAVVVLGLAAVLIPSIQKARIAAQRSSDL